MRPRLRRVYAGRGCYMWECRLDVLDFCAYRWHTPAGAFAGWLKAKSSAPPDDL